MLLRIDEIEEDLLARRARAEHEAWLGEVEGIDLTLTFLRQKREDTKRLVRIAPVELGMPVISAPRLHESSQVVPGLGEQPGTSWTATSAESSAAVARADDATCGPQEPA